MDNKMQVQAREAYGPILGNRWFQLISAVIAMVMIANLQYAWTMFATPLTKDLKVSLSVVQYAFTLFIMFETFVQPLGGYMLDRFGSKPMFILAGLLVGIGWTMMGQVHSIAALYFYYSMAGAGAGIIYGGSLSVAVRWFPDRRGLATGLIAAGFGMGSMPFIPVIAGLLKSSGVLQAFMYTGIFQGILIIVIAFLLRYPPGSKMPNKKEEIAKLDQSKIGFSPTQMLKTPHFWLIWSMFFAVNVGGLIITANTSPFGKKIGITVAYIVLAVTMNNFANGTGRFFWGWVSDRLGRYRTMFVAFGLNAVFLFLLPIFGKNNVLYVILLALIMFTWGEIFALFPTVNVDVFGATYAASNYGFLYSAKGIASILGGGLGAYLASKFGWNVVFWVAALFSLYASVMSLVVPRIPKPVKKSIDVSEGGVTPTL
ncbi:MAG: oxalate/formate MFS antiporter [Desulfitobacteriaceae bacterium]